jgi:hypothetical protein
MRHLRLLRWWIAAAAWIATGAVQVLGQSVQSAESQDLTHRAMHASASSAADSAKATSASPAVERVILPLAGYDSDTGITIGLVGQRFRYHPSFSPYLSSLRARAVVTTKGFFSFSTKWDALETFGSPLRSTLEITADRFIQEPLFLPGNGSVYHEPLWDAGYHFYERRELMLRYDGMLPIGGSAHRALIIAEAVWNGSIDQGEDTYLGSLTPDARQAGWVLLPGLGWRLDTRDHEIRPRKGLLAEVTALHSVPGVGSHRMGRLDLNLRHYTPLLTLPVFGEVVFAHQILARSTFGEVPYWMEARLGSRDALRGFALNRFQGRRSWAYMAELRSWFLEWEAAEIRFGGQFFWDVGRVFGGGESYGMKHELHRPFEGTVAMGPAAMGPATALSLPERNGLLEDLRHSVGFGGVMAVGGSDFFLRGDVGFSEETRRLYIGVGYAF